MKTENFEMITVQREYVLINENKNEFAVKSEHDLKTMCAIECKHVV